MSQAFPEHTGIREQHLLRKKDNPLFDASEREVSNEVLAGARMEDGVELDRFMSEFQSLVQRAATLEPNTPSETILEIKEALDRGYQQCCALPGDQTAVKAAIRRLIETIMRAVESGVGNDAYARQKLEDEVLAREMHFSLQELPLVAALTAEHSPIPEHELVPSLLSEPLATLEPTLQLFDAAQLAAIFDEASRFLAGRDPGHRLVEAWQRLRLIERSWRDRPSDTDSGRVSA
ncbi:MAG: hypothetical protein ACE5FQ_01095 [Thiogranum sp.]